MPKKFLSWFRGFRSSKAEPERPPQLEDHTILQMKQSYSLEELERGGCARRFSVKRCRFSETRTGVPSRIHLIKIPNWRHLTDDQDLYWAPSGYRALGLQALISVGTAYPELQKSRVIVATGAPDDHPPAACYYPYLSTDEKGVRFIGVPDWGVCWIGDNEKKDAESNFYGIFEEK